MDSLPPDLACGAFHAAPDAMIIVDDRGVIRFANQRVSALFNYSVDEIVGQQVEQLMPNRFRERHRRFRAQYAVSERLYAMGGGLDLAGRRRDGSEFPIEISLSPIGDETPALVAAAIRDVSERKRVERELIAARCHAERARQIAEHAGQDKSRFLATASHDLRQPLQVLALLHGMLVRTARDPDVREALAQQEQAIGAMSRLVNALLDISKLESGAIKPDLSDFAVAALFDELRREFANLACEKGLRLDVSGSTDCVNSDRSLIGQVLRNLLANAIKYTRTGTVSLRCLATPGPKLRIEVADTGIGIPLAQMRYIYDEFYQIDAGDGRPREGYGLGLSIVRHIAALLDLKLEVQSEPGQGSRFSVDLPVAHRVVASERYEAAAAPRGPSLAGIRVLVVDDDVRIRVAVRQLLENEGCRVSAAASRAEALDARTGRVDVVLADYHLGDGETGIDIIGDLRARLGESLPAILLTGDTSTLVKKMSTRGSLRIASKPINSRELFALLGELVDSGSRAGGGLRHWPEQ